MKNQRPVHQLLKTLLLGSLLMRHFTGGMLAHMAEHTVLSAHTVNAYRRLVPGNWSPRTPTWGMGNYSVAVRAIAAQAETARLEFRVPASDTNPHLAMAQMLATGLWGIENKTEPPKPVDGDARGLKFARKKALPRNECPMCRKKGKGVCEVFD